MGVKAMAMEEMIRSRRRTTESPYSQGSHGYGYGSLVAMAMAMKKKKKKKKRLRKQEDETSQMPLQIGRAHV